MSEAASSAPRAQGERPALHVVALVRSFGFPQGMAPTNRLRLVARALVEAGADVRVLVTRVSERPPVVENAATRGVADGVAFEYTTGSTLRSESFVLRRWRELRGVAVAALRLAQLRRAGRLDAVYFWPGARRWRLVPWLWRLGLRAAGVPLVCEANEMPYTLFRDRSLAERLTSPVRTCDGVVSISRYLSQWVRGEAARKGVDVDVVEVPILVDIAEQAVASYPSGDPLVVFAASSSYEETTRFVLEAMGLVWREFPACRLAVTGMRAEDRRSRWLLERDTSGGLDARIDLPGYLPRRDLLALYAQAHALLVPLFDDVRSRARFPTKIGEYAASGRPLVGTEVGEIDRYFTDGVDAYLSPPGDEAAYAEAVCRVLRDPQQAATVGRAGRALAEEAFDHRRHGAALYQFFAGVARRRSREAPGERLRRAWAGRQGGMR